MCYSMFTVCLHSDEGAVRALNELRLTAGDFEVKGIIGRGHFGEVGKTLPNVVSVILQYAHVYITQVQVVSEKSTGDVFAMKVMRKAHILQQADVRVIDTL